MESKQYTIQRKQQDFKFLEDLIASTAGNDPKTSSSASGTASKGAP